MFHLYRIRVNLSIREFGKVCRKKMRGQRMKRAVQERNAERKDEKVRMKNNE